MNSSELARLMLYWEDQKRGSAKTRKRIVEAVLELGRTVDTGNVRASYSAGRKRYDYAGHIAACIAKDVLGEEDIAPYRKTTVSTDYRTACADFYDADEVPFTQGEPGVTVKLLS